MNRALASAFRPGACPWLKIIQILEKVQQMATKRVKGFKNMNYTERLKPLNLTTLEKRRKRGDLIETYNIITGKEDIGSESLFMVADNVYGFRGHRLRLNKQPCRLNLRKNLFTQRVVNDWNRLLSCVVEAPSVSAFKNRLDEFLQDTDDLKGSGLHKSINNR